MATKSKKDRWLFSVNVAFIETTLMTCSCLLNLWFSKVCPTNVSSCFWDNLPLYSITSLECKSLQEVSQVFMCTILHICRASIAKKLVSYCLECDSFEGWLNNVVCIPSQKALFPAVSPITWLTLAKFIAKQDVWFRPVASCQSWFHPHGKWNSICAIHLSIPRITALSDPVLQSLFICYLNMLKCMEWMQQFKTIALVLLFVWLKNNFGRQNLSHW